MNLFDYHWNHTVSLNDTVNGVNTTCVKICPGTVMYYLKHVNQYVFRNDTMYFTVSVTGQLDMFGNIAIGH